MLITPPHPIRFPPSPPTADGGTQPASSASRITSLAVSAVALFYVHVHENTTSKHVQFPNFGVLKSAAFHESQETRESVFRKRFP